MNPKTSLRSFVALTGSALLVVSSVNATQYWDGTGSNANWSTPANWGGDLIPVWGTAIQFGGTIAGGTAVGTIPAAQTSAVNDLAAGTNIKGILLTNNGTTGRTQSFTLSGNSILVGTGTNDSITTTAISGANPAIEDVVALDVDFGTPAAANHNRVFNTGTNHNLRIDGVLSGAFSAAVPPQAYVMMKQGLGKLTLTNANNSYLGYSNIAGSTASVGNSVLEIPSIANGGVNSSIGASSNAATNLRFSYAVNGAHTNTLRYIGSTNGSTDRSIYLAGNTGSSVATNSAIESSGAGTLSFTRSAAIEFSNPGVPRNLYLGGTNTGDNVFNLSLSNNGLGVSTSTKQGDGKWILTNSHTYTGATTITGGKLTLGVTDCLANTSNVVIGAGTLDVGAGFTDTVGTLDCTGAATINLGDGSSQLTFADSFAVDWTDTDPDGTLNITGTFVSGSSLKFGDGTPNTGLTAGQLAAITINSVAGTYSLDGSGFLISGGGGPPYTTWAGGAVFTQDANGDGVKDGLAWFLGASAPGVNALDKLPVVATPTGFLTLDFDRVNPSTPAKLYVEYGNDLVGWTKVLIPAASGPFGGDLELTVTPGTPDQLLLKIPTATHEVGGKLFARLSATEN